MMVGESRRDYPTVEIPSWPVSKDYTMLEALSALKHYLPSNDPDPDSLVNVYSSDHFHMYDFKVRRCTRTRCHDWSECPYVHPGEKARRRDPRKYHYSGTACPDFRKGGCLKGDSCEFAHGVFECWLHPARYRTQPCKDGGDCCRKVCFFAHSPEQLRCLQNRHSGAFQLSPVSISPPASPRADSEFSPMTRSLSRSLGTCSINDVVASFRNLQCEKVNNSLPPRFNNQLRFYQSGYGSPQGSMSSPGLQSLSITPTRPGNMDIWDNGLYEETKMERVVESGRGLRAKMFEKLSKKNCMGRVESDPGEAPDVGWVSELVM